MEEQKFPPKGTYELNALQARFVYEAIEGKLAEYAAALRLWANNLDKSLEFRDRIDVCIDVLVELDSKCSIEEP